MVMNERISIQGEGKLSANLTKKEVRRVSYTGAKDINRDLPVLFELVRFYSGKKSVRVSSAHRNYVPKKHGAKDSAHLRGNALDLVLDAGQIYLFRQNFSEFLKRAYEFGLRGIGIYDWGVHIDTEGQKAVRVWNDGEADYYIRYWNYSKLDDLLEPSGVSTYDDDDSEDESEFDKIEQKKGISPLTILGALCVFFLGVKFLSK